MPFAAIDSSLAGRDRGIPEGFAAVPVCAAEMSACLRICILLRKAEGPAAFIVLRETMGGRAMLGCIADAAGVVHRWIEVWVQNPAGVSSMPGILVDSMSNAVLDQRWKVTMAAIESIDPAGLLRSGWESEPAPPIWIDAAGGKPVHPVDAATGDAWILCRDDAVLGGAGLPAYSTSLCRYLYQPKLGADSPLIPVTPGAPTTARTAPIESGLGGRTDLLPLNPGGLMYFRAFSPMSLEALSDLLAGRSDAIPSDDRLPKNLRAHQEDLQDTRGTGAWLFVGKHGRWGRLLEGFHLKLRVLAGAIAAVRSAIEHTRRPLLNISADSFRVSLSDPAPGVPRLWSARVVLADCGDAVEIPVRPADARFYLPRPRSGCAIYRPANLHEGSHGSATFRIRKTLAEKSDGVVVEGNLVTQERVDASSNDLAWVRLNLDSGAVDVYGHVEPEATPAAGSWRFRSIGQRLDANAVKHLRDNEGKSAPANFEILPVVGTPCDLYSLAVLAVRMLLVNGSTTLPAMLDEMLKLARQIANPRDASKPFRSRVRMLMEKDPRWLAALGPQRLAWSQITPEQALDMIPLELWTDTLAMIVSMFPGIGPDSTCPDLGGAPQREPHAVFDNVWSMMENLLTRTRSLIVIDWRYNREIHAVVSGFITGPK